MSTPRFFLILSIAICLLSCDKKNPSSVDSDVSIVASEKSATEAVKVVVHESSTTTNIEVVADEEEIETDESSSINEVEHKTDEEVMQTSSTQEPAKSGSTRLVTKDTRSDFTVAKEEQQKDEPATSTEILSKSKESTSVDVIEKEEVKEPRSEPIKPEEQEKKEEENQTTDTKAVVKNLHDQWQSLLQKHVSAIGVVNYKGLKSQESTLDTYLSDLSDHVPGSSDISKKAKAFWINAYNAYTVKLILDHYPVNSIRDISGGEPWDKKWIKLGAKTYSLNNIEHDILRPMWKDARIHFAVNCAAKSCPPLGNNAFTASNTNRLLEQLTKRFINHAGSNTISSSSLVLSKIFEWYKTDFGDLTGFIDKYTTVEIPSDVKITYQDYDWSLNGR